MNHLREASRRQISLHNKMNFRNELTFEFRLKKHKIFHEKDLIDKLQTKTSRNILGVFDKSSLSLLGLVKTIISL